MWTIPFRFEWRNLLPALAELRGAAVRIDAPPTRLGEPCPGDPVQPIAKHPRRGSSPIIGTC